ncbi:MAG: DUF5131 family protein, partial [Terriglobia bacterium]
SGPRARPMKKQWVLSIRDQCHQAGVPFFFKQWGGIRKSATGRQLDERTYDEFPRRIVHPAPGPKEWDALATRVEAVLRRNGSNFRSAAQATLTSAS